MTEGVALRFVFGDDHARVIYELDRLRRAADGFAGREAATGATRAGRNVTVNYAVTCDFSGNAPGDACTDADSYLCSADKTSMLRCKDKKIVATACRGPKKCTETPTQVDCDTSIAQIGESCVDGFACSTDAKATLKCASGKWAVDEKCKKSCTVSGNGVGCEG